MRFVYFFFFQAEDGIRDGHVTGVQTCALPIFVEAGATDECEIQLAYAIGVAEPVSITVNTDGKHDANIERAIRKTIDLTPAGIIRELGLDKPIFAATATGGHFGWAEFEWEQTPRLAEFKANLDA